MRIAPLLVASLLAGATTGLAGHGIAAVSVQFPLCEPGN